LLGRIAPADQFLTDIANHSLPSVSWIMPASDEASEHPPYNITTGELDVVSTINAVMSSEYWNSTAIFVTWDDYGGWYDHVTPPQVDQYGYGFRVPCLIISPYAKQGFIDNTQGDFTSILKFVETVFSLQPLTARDASANSLMEAFDFSQAPRQSLVLPGPYLPDHYPLTLASTTLSGNASTSSISATTSIASNTSGVPSSNPTDLIAVTLLAVPAIACLALLLWPRRSRRSRGGEPPDR
jgi:phospholipase C